MMLSRRFSFLAAACLPLVLLAACGTTSTPLAKPVDTSRRTVVLTPEMSGSAITLRMDQALTVSLREEPARNMRWERDMTSAYADRGVLTGPKDPEFERERLDQNAFGAAGFDVWQFKPKAPGQQVLRFEYRRIGRAEVPEQIAVYTVTVQ
jgi:predicted secreted protein